MEATPLIPAMAASYLGLNLPSVGHAGREHVRISRVKAIAGWQSQTDLMIASISGDRLDAITKISWVINMRFVSTLYALHGDAKAAKGGWNS
jgi:hypothetical protein